jgi:hypothetical protein
MLAGMRFRFLSSLLLAFFAAICLPVQAQINGVPASVTSIGFGGRLINGVPPSVTSLGPNGYGRLPFLGGCCANFFLQANPTPHSEHRHRRRDKDKDLVGVIEPVYVPYGVPEGVPDAGEADYDSPDLDYARGAGPLNPESLGRRVGSHDSTLNAYADDAGAAEVSVAAQRATVLVFKDGHRSEVFNYAVVGDTLFDFADDRTHKILLADLDLSATQKANDDRGVDFQIPADTTQ